MGRGKETPMASTASPAVPQSVSERKREEIRRAALDLFIRDGYERTSVDAIAAEAGVSKRTVYNHFGDKENLFLSVLQDTFSWMIGLVDEVIERQLGNVREQSAVEPALVATLLEVARTITQLPERAALIRLIIAEATRFPTLLQPWRDRGTVTDAFAARLTRLADRGLLAFDDPVQATQHLTALTLNQLNTRSLFGTLPVPDAEVERVIRSGVHVYLLAYGPRG
jgi:TetR/AcrR family transcriptional regulator, mexJK operon transcriptional repressor